MSESRPQVPLDKRRARAQVGCGPAVAIAGKRILLVEDEPIVAMLLEDILADLGFEVVGPALHLPLAAELARSEVLDAAILDVNMGDGPSYCVAAILKDRGVPYLFATGYGAEGLDPGHENVAVLQKPYLQIDIAAALATLLADAQPRRS